ncbi:hypothetical protein M5689_015791 [Euphorbia peplus]|nr:hypothetical protein M5689_015791 [Euphorbia peplus]
MNMIHLKVNFIDSYDPISPCLVHFNIPPNATILYLKHRIKALYPQIDSLSEQLILRYNGESLSNGHSLESYGIQDDSVIDLHVTFREAPPRLPEVRFYVSVSGNMDFEMVADRTIKIKELKELVADKMQLYTAKCLVLYHKNVEKGIHVEMDDARSLNHYKLDENSIITAWER